MPGGTDNTSVTTTAVDPQTHQPSEPGAINGGMFQREGRLSAPVITVGVSDVDGSLAKDESAGGSMIVQRTAIEGMGAFAYFTGPEGSVMRLWKTRS